MRGRSIELQSFISSRRKIDETKRRVENFLRRSVTTVKT